MTADTYIAISSLAVAAASLVLSVIATLFAKGSLNRAEDSLRRAEKIAIREQQDWRQRKWFDLYLKANEAYDALERFQIQYGAGPPQPPNDGQWKQDFNNLIYVFRAVHALAMVFPVDPVVTELCLATADFQNVENVLAKKRLERIFDAMNSVREKALVDPDVLGQDPH